MPEFIADTDGTVCNLQWGDLADFTQGYLEAMLFTNTSCIPMTEWHTEESREQVREGQADGDLPNDAGFGDLFPKSFEATQMDCIAFEHKAHDLLMQAYAQGYDRKQAGRDFWFTRNRHGVGFLDRKELEGPDCWKSFGSPKVGDPRWQEYIKARDDDLAHKLDAMASEFGEVYVSFSEEDDDSSPTGYGFIYLQ